MPYDENLKVIVQHVNTQIWHRSVEENRSKRTSEDISSNAAAGQIGQCLEEEDNYA